MSEYDLTDDEYFHDLGYKHGFNIAERGSEVSCDVPPDIEESGYSREYIERFKTGVRSYRSIYIDRELSQ